MNCNYTVKLVSILLLFELANCACPSRCLHRFGKKCFFFEDSWAPLAKNVNLCRTMNGTLVSIESKQENEFLMSILNKKRWYWIGLRRPIVGIAEFTWIDGASLNYTNWASLRPDSLSKPEWGAYIDIGNGHWYDAAASSIQYQLCQWIVNDSKNLERITCEVDELVDRMKVQEKLTRDLSELAKQAIRRVSDVTQNFTAALEKISRIDHRLAAVETSNRRSNTRSTIVSIGKLVAEGIEIFQPSVNGSKYEKKAQMHTSYVQT